MIDYKEIQTLYPNAYAALLKFCYPNSNYTKDILVEVTNDKLYEFFDSVGLFLWIIPHYTVENFNYRFYIADKEVQYSLAVPIVSIGYDSRNHATKRMFNNAFTQLENRLS